MGQVAVLSRLLMSLIATLPRRTVLLLQGFTRYMETLLAGSQGRPPTASHVTGAQMSIGLVVKKFWNKMMQLYNLFQQLQTEVGHQSVTTTEIRNYSGIIV